MTRSPGSNFPSAEWTNFVLADASSREFNFSKNVRGAAAAAMGGTMGEGAEDGAGAGREEEGGVGAAAAFGGEEGVGVVVGRSIDEDDVG